MWAQMMRSWLVGAAVTLAAAEVPVVAEEGVPVEAAGEAGASEPDAASRAVSDGDRSDYGIST